MPNLEHAVFIGCGYLKKNRVWLQSNNHGNELGSTGIHKYTHLSHILNYSFKVTFYFYIKNKISIIQKICPL